MVATLVPFDESPSSWEWALYALGPQEPRVFWQPEAKLLLLFKHRHHGALVISFSPHLSDIAPEDQPPTF